jgi:biopolymer transport protein ExbD
MQRLRRRRPPAEVPQIQLTSLMDVMTILLVFLLRSYSTDDVQLRPSAELRLPVSSATQRVETAVNTVISQVAITVDGVKVADVTDGTVASDLRRGAVITPLFEVLKERADEAKAIEERRPGAPFTGRLLLQADRDIPFRLVRDVLYTAGQAQFGEIRFVVLSSRAD